MKAISLDELDKYIRTNKITVYSIWHESKKTSPIYVSNDEQSIEETITKAYETFDGMPSDIYKFKGKPTVQSPNNTWVETEVQVGTYQTNTAPKISNNRNMQASSFQDEIDRQVKAALELKEKEYALKESERLFRELEKRFDKLEKSHKELELDFTELLDVLNLEGIKGSGGGTIKDMATKAVSTVAEYGTKKVVDRFATLQK